MTTEALMRVFVKAVYDSGLSAAEICRRGGIHAHTISRWMNGGGLPNMQALVDVLDLLGYDLQIVRRDPPANDDGVREGGVCLREKDL